MAESPRQSATATASACREVEKDEQRPARVKTPWQRAWHVVRRYPLPVGALALLGISLMCWLVGKPELARWPLLLILLGGGVPLLWQTLRQLWHREFGVDLLALLAIGGSFILGQYLAGALIVLMLSGGEALEAYALRRAKKSLSALAERAPRWAHVRQGDDLITVDAADVMPGMCVIVKPGEIVPVDGVVSEGASGVSEADLTGEPVPVRKEPGALVLSGSVNLESVLQVRATKRAAESQYAQIVRLVEEAQQHKAPIHRLADRYAVWFTALALVIAAGAWIVSGDSLYALAVLVVATPCPLILATPIAIMSGVDLAAHNGIITKSGATIEQLGEVDVAVFDKTGTLTLGTPQLVEIVPLEQSHAHERAQMQQPDHALYLAAALEQFSPHILARGVVEAARQRGVRLALATDVDEVAGKGLRGRVPAEDGASVLDVAIGNRSYMGRLEIPIPPSLLAQRELRTAQGQIASFLAIEGEVVGLLVFADVPRPELTQLAARLHDAGIRETVLLTGDGETVARQIGALAHVDRVVAQCLPEEKVRVVTDLEHKGRHVLMVGDGVNDAPALAAATVGLAMGAQGLTAAAAAADGVLLSTDILLVSTAVSLGRHVLRVAKQGIWVGIGLSIIAMMVAAAGYLPPAAGAILQEGIDVLVILNALRAGRDVPQPRVISGDADRHDPGESASQHY